MKEIKESVHRVMGRKTRILALRAVQYFSCLFNDMQIYSSNFTIFLKGKQSYFVFLINTDSFSLTIETRVY